MNIESFYFHVATARLCIGAFLVVLGIGWVVFNLTVLEPKK